MRAIIFCILLVAILAFMLPRCWGPDTHTGSYPESNVFPYQDPLIKLTVYRSWGAQSKRPPAKVECYVYITDDGVISGTCENIKRRK